MWEDDGARGLVVVGEGLVQLWKRDCNTSLWMFVSPFWPQFQNHYILIIIITIIISFSISSSSICSNVAMNYWPLTVVISNAVTINTDL